MKDDRTPEQLKADGDHRWPDGTRYTPPHLAGGERERFVRRRDELDWQDGPGAILPVFFTSECILRDDAESLRDACVFGSPASMRAMMAAGKARPRSPRWRAVREEHVRRHPACAACGRTARLDVHHIQSFHTHPELELAPANLLTLCESWPAGVNCHLLIGHCGDWKAINPESVKYARAMLRMLGRRVEG